MKTEMLKNVLATYAEENDVIGFVTNLEEQEKTKIYTEKRGLLRT
jgi:hypothetical protein